MATQITHPTKDLYEQDFYAWSRRQAELLRLQRFSDLDLAHLTLEIEDLGEAVYRSVRSTRAHDHRASPEARAFAGERAPGRRPEARLA
jgi:hypothetical protein